MPPNWKQFAYNLFENIYIFSKLVVGTAGIRIITWCPLKIQTLSIPRRTVSMPFEVFDKKAATASKSPMVTIQKQGSFSLNRAAYKLIEEPEAVELLFDRAKQLIGFRPASPDSPRSYPVRPQGKSGATLMIAGQAFTKYYKLDTSVARRYSAKVTDGILVVDLKGESVDVTGPRSAMKSRLGKEQ